MVRSCVITKSWLCLSTEAEFKKLETEYGGKRKTALILSQSRGRWKRVCLKNCAQILEELRHFVAWSQSLRVNDKAQSNEGLASPPSCFVSKVIAGVKHTGI